MPVKSKDLTPRTPEPISKHIVCSLCGLQWDRHGKEPTVEKCVELLKADLAKQPVYRGYLGTSVNASAHPTVFWGGNTGSAA